MTYFEQLDVFVNREVVRNGGESGRVPDKFGEGEVFIPEEGVDRIVAMKLYTIRSAEFHMAEEKIGSLEVGKFADFAVIDKDYLSGPDTEIRSNKVLMTVQADQTVYLDPNFKPAEK
jgi:predicted amidohydrolase YtcJ